MTNQKAVDAAGSGDPLETVTHWLATRQSERPLMSAEGNDRPGWLEMFQRTAKDTDMTHRYRLLNFIRDFREDESMDVVGVIFPMIDAVKPGEDFEPVKLRADALMAQAVHDQADLAAMEALLIGSTIERVQYSYSVAAWEARHDG